MSEPEFRIRLGVVWLYGAVIATLSVLFLYFPNILQFFLLNLIGLLS